MGLFTDKVEITQKKMSDEEIDSRIKDKLSKFMGVIDVVEAVSHPAGLDDEPSVPPAAPFTMPAPTIRESAPE